MQIVLFYFSSIPKIKWPKRKNALHRKLVKPWNNIQYELEMKSGALVLVHNELRRRLIGKMLKSFFF